MFCIDQTFFDCNLLCDWYVVSLSSDSAPCVERKVPASYQCTSLTVIGCYGQSNVPQRRYYQHLIAQTIKYWKRWKERILNFFEIPYLSVIDDHTSGKPLLMQAYLAYARVVLDTWIYQVERNTITRISMDIQWQNWAYRWEPFSFYLIKCIIESIWYMNPKCSNLPKIIFIYCNYYIN